MTSALSWQPLPCFIPYSKVKFACYSRCFLTSYFCIPVPYNEKDIFFWVLIIEGLVGLHRTIQLQLLQHYWLVQRLGLPWYWMVCLGKEQRSFCRFWGCIHSALMGRTHSDLETASGLPPPDSSLSLRQGLVTYLLFWFCHHRNRIGEKAAFLKLERETHGGGWEGLCCPLSVGFC